MQYIATIDLQLSIDGCCSLFDENEEVSGRKNHSGQGWVEIL
jgi:hypothetical protein